ENLPVVSVTVWPAVASLTASCPFAVLKLTVSPPTMRICSPPFSGFNVVLGLMRSSRYSTDGRTRSLPDAFFRFRGPRAKNDRRRNHQSAGRNTLLLLNV